MIARDVTYQKREGVAVIRMDSPPNDQEELVHLAYDLSDICSEFASDNEIRIVIITGSRDDSFSIGANLFVEPITSNVEQPIGFWSFIEPLANYNRPIIAATTGDVVGLGLELALACDIRIAAEGSHFGFPHIKWGIIPWDGGTQRLLRVVGKAKAMEMILTGERINAQDAYRIGLVNRIVSPLELTAVVMDTAQEMASKSPISLEYAKEAINKGMDLTLEQGLRLEADLYFLLQTTGDRIEGIKAFQEKRKAQFKGK